MSPLSLKSLFDLSGKTALVTGASRGLGVPMCEALGEFGAKILLVARKQGELDEAVAHLQGMGVDARAIAADVGKLTEPARIVSEIEAAGDRVDILVNNAGTSWGSNSEDLPVDAWNKLMAVNLTAPFLLAQAVAKTFMLPAGWGRIINIASVEGFLGHHPRMVGTLAYNTSKGGLINFTRALAAEWASKGVNVNAIAPGYFPSKLTGYILDKHGADIVQDTPRGVLGVDEDLKGATLLLASNAGAHIVGQVLTIDGGASII